MGWRDRISEGVFNKDKSLATGVMLAFVTWALTRLVDGVTAHNTLSYDVTNKAATLGNGTAGFVYQVKFTNLSGDTPLKSLKAVVSAPHSDLVFSVDDADRGCAVEPPAWGGKVGCEAFASGFMFEAPTLVAGTYAGFEVKYTRPPGSGLQPVLRIQPDESQNFRLVESGVQTFAAKNQSAILFVLLLFGVALLVVSLATGIKDKRPASG